MPQNGITQITADETTVTVFFDPTQSSENRFTYKLPGETSPHTNLSISINQPAGLVIFQLTTQNSETPAEFATDPILWLLDQEGSFFPPSGFWVSRRSGVDVLITDFNPGTEETVLPFEIRVTHQGNPFSSHEPTIINTPITGGS